MSEQDREDRRRMASSSSTPEQYHVLREKGTERAFTGEYWNTKTPGRLPLRRLRRRSCSTPSAKFDSGCGWPSFYQRRGRRDRRARRPQLTAWSAPR